MDTLKFVVLSGLAWASSCAIATGSAGNAAAGKTAFEAACARCHQIGPSARAGFGPQLNGIVGRRAGTTTDHRYSTAMRNSKIVWTEQSLAAFIKDPEGTVPGTTMRFFGLGYTDRKVADLVAYLQTYPPTGRTR